MNDYEKGLKDGWNKAVDQLLINRDNFRRLLEVKNESHEDALDRIATTHIGSPDKSIPDRILDVTLDGMDLYVILRKDNNPVVQPAIKDKRNEDNSFDIHDSPKVQ